MSIKEGKSAEGAALKKKKKKSGCSQSWEASGFRICETEPAEAIARENEKREAA